MLNRMLKSKAKQLILSTKPSPLIAGIIVTAVHVIVSVFQLAGSNDAYNSLISSGSYTYADILNAMYTDITSNVPMLVFQCIFIILTSYISFGLLCYSLKLTADGEAPKIQELFPPVLLFLKNIALSLMIYIVVVFGLFFFIVPGIFFAACYSQAKYIMLENPQMSLIQCMTASRKMMRGRVPEYIILSLSFLGWLILASLSVTVVVGVWSYPYINVTLVLYYRELKSVGADAGATE